MLIWQTPSNVNIAGGMKRKSTQSNFLRVWETDQIQDVEHISVMIVDYKTILCYKVYTTI